MTNTISTRLNTQINIEKVKTISNGITLISYRTNKMIGSDYIITDSLANKLEEYQYYELFTEIHNILNIMFNK